MFLGGLYRAGALASRAVRGCGAAIGQDYADRFRIHAANALLDHVGMRIYALPCVTFRDTLGSSKRRDTEMEMAFTKSTYSNKTGECRRLADHIAAAAAAMGLVADVDASRQSASHYVYVSTSADADEQIKIRCSDHSDRHGGSDWYTWNGECPSITIARMADHFGRPVPAGYRWEDYVARSATAKAAARIRNQDRQATEAEMIAAVVEAMRTAKSVSKLAAGKVVDGMYPAIPRAQRQRIAYDAVAAITRDRAIAGAAGDETALADLATRYPQAMAVLFNTVGPERFAALRPAGFPRPCWQVGA